MRRVPNADTTYQPRRDSLGRGLAPNEPARNSSAIAEGPSHQDWLDQDSCQLGTGAM